MIPKAYFDHIQNVYGEAGRSWIARIPVLIKRAEIVWELSDLEIYEHLSYNLLLRGKSKKYGQVMLKIGVLNDEYRREIKFLNELRSSRYVTCYDVLMEEGMILMALLIPGTRLNEIKVLEERIFIAGTLLSYTPKVSLHPSYMKYHRAMFTETMKKNKEKIRSSSLFDYLGRAEGYYIELMALFSEAVILHGDLHHENMIYDEAKGWQIIDPKGYLGMKILEPGRYIINQIWEDIDKGRDWTKETVSYLSEVLGYSEELLYKSAYIDCMLSSTWSLEDGYCGEKNIKTFEYLQRALL